MNIQAIDKEKIIGIVGGVGPYASLELCRKIFDQTNSNKDQEHLSVTLMSLPSLIEDRTTFILGKTNINPAYAILMVIEELVSIGAKVIGIPCNAVHAPQIFSIIMENVKKSYSDVKLLNMISEVADFIRVHHPYVRSVGVLSTNGTFKSNVYKDVFIQKGIKVISPNEELQNNVINKSIYDLSYGIKAKSNPVSDIARAGLLEGILHLKRMGAEVVVLGCTEMPLAITESILDGVLIIDSVMVLARALIREVDESRLKMNGD